MEFDFASEVAHARRVVHDTLGLPATYQDASMDTPEPVRVRWHNKLKLQGDLLEIGYAQVLEGIDRIILVPSDTPDILFKQGGVVFITPYALGFTLDHMEPESGPLEQVWRVTPA
jgi:hypothetical protein